MLKQFFIRCAISMALAGSVFTALPAMAQNLFAPAVQVNERVITHYERDQRVRMIQLFRSPGVPEVEAMKALINERLQLEEAQRAGISVTTDEVAEGMGEFASRANLSGEEFTKALNQAGVDTESYRDFVAAGLAWRKVIRERFAGRVNLSESDIDKAVKRQSTSPVNVRVLLSEIILPANTPAAAAAAERRASEISRISTLPAFASAARNYSASPSRGASGRIDWMPIGNLPPAIAAQVLSLPVGGVTQPIPVPNAIALFQVRAIEESATATAATTEVDYAAFYIAGGRSAAALAEAARVRAQIDTCEDLYGVAKGLPAQQLERVTAPLSQVPGDVALELAKLDENEVSTGLTRADGQTLVFLMLCNRGHAANEEAPVDREAVRTRLLNERLSSMATALMAELRANATIVYPLKAANYDGTRPDSTDLR
ncbi:peptidylprolyl isomerase [Oceaniovalibus sp. ACAM 378]|uniref:peptidylprolyl isomerase n=1 Tax=Oceaniovalibus sp. ACAM 378 TaxID=2599923 RepID=UPI0016525282|nr:peptidylprolyl isomerase [Oceaniovalibus sp. ACAM 378]